MKRVRMRDVQGGVALLIKHLHLFAYTDWFDGIWLNASTREKKTAGEVLSGCQDQMLPPQRLRCFVLQYSKIEAFIMISSQQTSHFRFDSRRKLQQNFTCSTLFDSCAATFFQILRDSIIWHETFLNPIVISNCSFLPNGKECKHLTLNFS